MLLHLTGATMLDVVWTIMDRLPVGQKTCALVPEAFTASAGGGGKALSEIDTGAETVVAALLSLASAVSTYVPDARLLARTLHGLAVTSPILFAPAKN